MLRLQNLMRALNTRGSAAAATTVAVAADASLAPQAASGYRLPPKEIADIVDAPPQPVLSFSPDRKWVAQIGRPPSNPPITELSRPELKLAGLRIDPETFTRSRMSYSVDITLAAFNDDLQLPMADGQGRRVAGIPPGYWFNYVVRPKSHFFSL